uniref:EF-hand domain-containing protein n=2 Tax=Amphimedon queenslandica TaxID=400682 RepID=A0A1X7U6U0_AMPQE
MAAPMECGTAGTDDLMQEVATIKAHIEQVRVQKRERLRTMDFFCLDNSIRESTVGQLKSHTLQNKIDIYNHVKKCGIKDVIVASFANMKRVDDVFVKWLRDQGEDFTDFVSFSEVTEGVVNGVYDSKKVPVGLRKNKRFGLLNNFFEFDLADSNCEWGTKFTVDDMCQLLKKRIDQVREFAPNGKILLNFRDFPIAMTKYPDRVLYIVRYLSRLPEGSRMFALCFEDPLGEYLPEELEAWTASMRRVMDSNGFSDGKILVHIHQKWDLQTASQLDCLSAGADGVWASLCEEGAAVGHACSSVTMMNLIRLGNQKILKKYNCTQLRKAAIAVTKLTTGKMPHPKQMKEQMLADLRKGRKEEYHSPAGIVLLFDRSGGKLTPAMADVIAKQKLSEVHHDNLIAKIREEWDSWDLREEGENKGDGRLEFDSFYHGFMAPYFGCYRCGRTKKGLKALDMDNDGFVDWNEFLVYIKWALRQYPDTEEPDDLLSIVFEKGLMPAMRDEKIRRERIVD